MGNAEPSGCRAEYLADPRLRDADTTSQICTPRRTAIVEHPLPLFRQCGSSKPGPPCSCALCEGDDTRQSNLDHVPNHALRHQSGEPTSSPQSPGYHVDVLRDSGGQLYIGFTTGVAVNATDFPDLARKLVG